MKIETKYDIGQEVWILIKGKPYKSTIKLFKYSGGNIICGLVDNIMCRYFESPESFVFPTKEELLKSL